MTGNKTKIQLAPKVAADVYYSDGGWWYTISFPGDGEWEEQGPFVTKASAVAGVLAEDIPSQLAELAKIDAIRDEIIASERAEFRRRYGMD